jgi:tRNA(Ile)-lysidine synthase
MLRAAIAIKESFGGKGQLFAAHLNHGWRGAEGDADAAWLVAMCNQLGIQLQVGQSDVVRLAQTQGDGLEAAARTARYQFLRHTAESLGARYVAVAHTADDQVETVLQRILRGTGIAGLRGIPQTRPLAASVSLVRPILHVCRRDVLDYLAEVGQDFRVDSSNSDLRWTRNRLRHQLLPALREYCNADIDAALLRLANQAADTQTFIENIARRLAEKCVRLDYAPAKSSRDQQPVDQIRIAAGVLAEQAPLVIREVCKTAWDLAGWPRQAMGYDEWRQLAELVLSEAGAPAVNLPGNIRASRSIDELLLKAVRSA